MNYHNYAHFIRAQRIKEDIYLDYLKYIRSFCEDNDIILDDNITIEVIASMRNQITPEFETDDELKDIIDELVDTLEYDTDNMIVGSKIKISKEKAKDGK